jgi:hypothetical protein
VFTAVTMKNAVFWDVTPCGFCSSAILVILMKAIRSSEAPVLTRVKRRNIPEDVNLFTNNIYNLQVRKIYL